MIIYGLKNCDACKALLKVEPDFELIDVSITPVPENILEKAIENFGEALINNCLLYTSPSPRDGLLSRMPSSA